MKNLWIRLSVLNFFTPLRIMVLYFASSILWIGFTDQLLLAIVSDPTMMTHLQSLKGWFYVLVTLMSFYWIIERNHQSILNSETARIKLNEELNQVKNLGQKQLEEILSIQCLFHESERRYYNLAKVSGLAIFRLDLNGNCIYANQLACDMMGLTLEASLQRGWTSVLHPDNRDIVLTQWEQTITRNVPFLSEHKLLDPNGKVIWVRTQAIAEQDDTGKLIGYFGTLTDITIYKTLEMEVQELKLELNKQTSISEELNAEVSRLERDSELKDDFLSTVSHELRAPVTNMKMAIEMLSTLNQSDNQNGMVLPAERVKITKRNRYLQILENECNREINLINNLLDLKRLEGDNSLDYDQILLKNWLVQVIEPFKERANQRNQTLDILLAQNLEPIYTNLSSLERIVCELLNNACKYTPKGGAISLMVDQYISSNNGREKLTRLVVSNSSDDIPSSELSRIFDKFYRLTNYNPNQEGGTGLGLALVKELVERLGGRVWAQSENNQVKIFIEL